MFGSGDAPANVRLAHRKPPWLVLSVGFGGLLLCIMIAAAATLFVLERVRDDESRARKAFLEHLASLDQIRTQIYLSGTYVRDFLLAPDPAAATAQAARLTTLEHETRGALKSYSLSLEPEENKPFQALRSEIEAYWRVLDGTMAWSPGERNRLRYSFFYNDLVPRRTTMLQIANRIAAVHERSLNRAEERLAGSANALRSSLEITFAVTLLGGLALALVTIGFTLQMERELEHRLSENLSARNDLQELSARLVRAQEIERRSLARELHDEIGQSLSAILMEAEGAECAEEQPRRREHLASIRKLAEKTVAEVRDLALLLRPSMLDDLGLVPALNWHAREIGVFAALLVPRYGAQGGAVAAVLGDATLACLIYWRLRAAAGPMMVPAGFLVRLAAASAVGCAALLVPGIPGVAAAALAGVAFLVFGHFIGMLPEELEDALWLGRLRRRGSARRADAEGAMSAPVDARSPDTETVLYRSSAPGPRPQRRPGAGHARQARGGARHGTHGRARARGRAGAHGRLGTRRDGARRTSRSRATPRRPRAEPGQRPVGSVSRFTTTAFSPSPRARRRRAPVVCDRRAQRRGGAGVLPYAARDLEG